MSVVLLDITNNRSSCYLRRKILVYCNCKQVALTFPALQRFPENVYQTVAMSGEVDRILSTEHRIPKDYKRKLSWWRVRLWYPLSMARSLQVYCSSYGWNSLLGLSTQTAWMLVRDTRLTNVVLKILLYLCCWAFLFRLRRFLFFRVQLHVLLLNVDDNLPQNKNFPNFLILRIWNVW